MSHRILILYNRDEGLAHGEAADALAATAVLEAVRGVEDACHENGWRPEVLAAPEDPRALLEVIDRQRADCIFNLVEALGGEVRFEAAVAWMFELAGIPYTGSPPLALSVALQKPLTRAVLRGADLPVPAGCLLARGDEPIAALRPPFIVKPSREDASHGISLESVVEDVDAARRRARYVIERYRQPALIEEFIEGREFNVSILGEGEDAFALPLGEIDFSDFPGDKPRLVTYTAKWVESSPECLGTKPIPARELDAETATRLAGVAVAAYRAIGLRDYGRIDLRLHPREGPYILDVNSNPDISPGAGLARAALRSGMTYAQLIAHVVQGAHARGAAPPTDRPR
jgi:D-alanine-D-alanine ligase